MVKRFDLFGHTRIQFFALFAFVLCVLLIPIFGHRYISINDLINHISRVWLLLHLGGGSSVSAFYRVSWAAVPNIAIDVFGYVMGRFLPLGLVAKSFVAVVFFLNLTGVAHLHHVAHRRWSIWPLIAAPLMFSRILLAGLVNFLFGIGLTLHAIAFWIGLKHRPLLRMVSMAIFATAIFLSHLFAFGLLGLALLGVELEELLEHKKPPLEWLRKLAELSLPFVPALLIFALLTPHGDVTGSVRYHPLLGRITAFGTPILYDTVLDAALYACLFVAILVAVLKSEFRIYRPLAGAALVLVVAQLVSPFTIMSSTNVDQRAPILICLILIAATDVSSVSFVRQRVFAVMLFSVLALRVWSVDSHWRASDAIYSDVDRTLSVIPPGAKVATGFALDRITHASAPAIAAYYLPVRASVRRGGFDQTLFALPLQNVVTPQPAYQALADRTSENQVWNEFAAQPAKTSKHWRQTDRALRSYDYVVFIDTLRKPHVRAAPWMKLVADGAWSQVFRIKR